MVRQIVQRIQIPASPERVWSVVGDVAAVADWVPALDSSALEGDIRYAEFAGGGGQASERIVAHDPAARSYTYEYLSGPLALDSYSSTLSVHADEASAGGAVVEWTAEFAAADPETEAGLAEAIDGICAAGLLSLRERFGR